MAVLSALFYATLFVGGLLFIRHMWKELQKDGEGSLHHRTLDEIQQLQFRLETVHERLQERMDRLEGKLDALPPPSSPEGEEAPEDPSPPPPSTTRGS
jgi:hypothetical protein